MFNLNALMLHATVLAVVVYVCMYVFILTYILAGKCFNLFFKITSMLSYTSRYTVGTRRVHQRIMIIDSGWYCTWCSGDFPGINVSGSGSGSGTK